MFTTALLQILNENKIFHFQRKTQKKLEMRSEYPEFKYFLRKELITQMISDNNTNNKETSQELRKLTATSYLESKLKCQ